MINEKDILARLQNGESADDIAQALIDVLNSAKDKYDEELAAQAKANEEANAKLKLEAEKQDDMDIVLNAIYDFIYKWYCEDDEDIADLDKIFGGFTSKDAINLIEEAGAAAIEMTKMFNNINNLCFATEAPNKNVKPATFEFVIDDKKDADFVINSFLKSLGL